MLVFASRLSRRQRKASPEFERYFWLLRIFSALFAVLAYEMEVVLLSFSLANSEALAVLPYVALVAGDRVRTIVLKTC